MKKSSATRVANLVIGVLLIALVVLGVGHTLSGWQTYREAHQIEALTSVDHTLVATAVSIRSQLPVIQTALQTEKDPRRTIGAARSEAGQHLNEALGQLDRLNLEQASSAKADILASWQETESLASSVMEQATRQVNERELKQTEPWRTALLGLFSKFSSASTMIGNQVRIADPILGEDNEVRRMAWTIRDAYGAQCSLLRSNIEHNQLPDAQQSALFNTGRGSYANSLRNLENLTQRPGFPAEMKQAITATRNAVETAQSRIDAVVKGLDGSGNPAMPAKEWTALCNAPFDGIMNIAFLALDHAQAHAAEHKAQALIELGLSMGGLMLAMLAGVASAIVMRLRIVRPLNQLRDAMKRLAQGDMDVSVPELRHHDEIRAMADAVEVFKKNAIEADRLRKAQDEQRVHADRDKRTALLTMAETVEQEMRRAVDHVAKSTERMSSNALQMADSARSVGSLSQDVAAAATQALSNTQTVAAATEQMSVSISEIGRQVGTSSVLTTEAVGRADNACTTIGRLADAVDSIGMVVQLIDDIASQTNLLALNATIEAARAGESGKGFAVVANEVKILASQTTKATGDISRQIEAVQTTTAQAVAAVAGIADNIRGIERVSTAIAASVDQQSAATHEIARNVSQTAGAANEVSVHIAQVSDEARTTTVRAEDVSAGAGKVAVAIDLLRDSLVRVVRTAMPEVDRRRHPRYKLDRQIAVELDGRSYDVRLVDISRGGALFELGSPASEKMVYLNISGLGDRIQADILNCQNGQCHVAFKSEVKADFFADGLAACRT